MKITVTKDIVYDEENKMKLDLYQPAEMNSAAIIDIHGGGWFQGDKYKDEDWARMWAELGYLVIVPNYRLAPEFLYPAALEDVDVAYHWLQKTYPVIKKIGIVGSSAGGTLAIELALKYGTPAVSLSGIIEIATWLAEHEDVVPQRNAPQVNKELASNKIDQDGSDDPFYKWFVLNYAGNQEAKIKAISPLHRVNSNAGPMFLANSLNELVPITGILKLQEALLKQGVSVATEFVTGTAHGKGFLAEAQPYVAAFMAQNLLQ